MKVSAYFGSHRDDPCSIASAMAKAMRLYDSQTCRSFKVARGSLAGVAAGTLVASFLTQTFVVPQYACRKAGINWWRYVIVIGGSGVVAGGLFASICYGVQYRLACQYHRVVRSMRWFNFLNGWILCVLTKPDGQMKACIRYNG